MRSLNKFDDGSGIQYYDFVSKYRWPNDYLKRV